MLAPIREAEALAENVMASSGKRMVFISSVRSSIASIGGGHHLYRSTKAALNAAMVSLSLELASRGVICVSMHPGWVRTDMGGDCVGRGPGQPIRHSASGSGTLVNR